MGTEGGVVAQLVVNGGVSVVLAYVVLRWQRADLTGRAEQCARCMQRVLAMAEREREDKLLMMEALRNNTEALTRLVDAVRGVGHRSGAEAPSGVSGWSGG